VVLYFIRCYPHGFTHRFEPVDIFIHNPSDFQQHLILVDILEIKQIKKPIVTNSFIKLFSGKNTAKFFCFLGLKNLRLFIGNG
jgi:hypothetical protein